MLIQHCFFRNFELCSAGLGLPLTGDCLITHLDFRNRLILSPSETP